MIKIEEENLKNLTFDKLIGFDRTQKEETIYDFKCDFCKSKNIKIIPVGIPTKPVYTDNSDLENKIPDSSFARLNRLPTIHKAIKENHRNLIFVCKDCNQSASIKKDIDARQLNRWVKKHFDTGSFII